MTIIDERNVEVARTTRHQRGDERRTGNTNEMTSIDVMRVSWY